ncbi:MAG: phenylacetate-CoA oxygenase subunit PaaJ [Hamadaea sp.]|nr:phenylacetate-CoA oxygenase subunit PaaJ [Hamadaea sp.]
MVDVQAVAGAVLDPELRVVTIAELGVLRSARVLPDQTVRVEITPTYAGCPAMDAIREDIRSALTRVGHPEVEVVTVLSPPWSTDMITPSGRDALARAGIAPPTAGPVALTLSPVCPRCGSGRTEEISRFGPTACQSIWRCTSCLEPFDHVRRF